MTGFLFAGRLRRLALLSALTVALVGCSNATPTGSVNGKVLLDGQPYENASVVLLSMESGQGASVDIQSGGTFTIPSLPVGTYTAYLAPKSAPESDAPVPVKIDTSVPEKYWNEASSDIKITVNEGPNDATVDLKK